MAKLSNSPRIPGLTWRSLVVGIAFIAANCYWTVQVQALGTTSSTFRPEFHAPFMNAIFSLFALVALNQLFKRLSPRLVLSAAEMIVVYVMVCIAFAICCTHMAQVIVCLMTYPFWYATPQNNWASLFHQYIPTWLSVRDQEVLKPFYEGHSTLYTASHLHAWLTPILAWSALIFLLLFIMLCLNTIIRSQWTEKERLSYPIVQLPLAMTMDAPFFYRNKLMWIGFGLAAALKIVNGLHFLYPSIPRIPTEGINVLALLPRTQPWTALWSVHFNLIPAVIGVGFLIPLDLLFSAWFFFMLGQPERMVAQAMNWGLTDPIRNCYIFERALGAYLGLAISVLWIGRRHLKQVLNKALGRSSPLDDSEEPMPYRWAVGGLVLASILLFIFCSFAGMSASMIVGFFVIYFLICLAITRLRAELGFGGEGLSLGLPARVMVTTLGSARISPADLTMFTVFYGFNRFYHANPMPQQLEGLKMAHSAKMNSRHMAAAIVVATVVGAFCSFWLLLHFYYKVGAAVYTTYGFANMFGKESFPQLASWLELPHPTHFPRLANMAAGAAITMLLTLARSLSLRWPLHPVGYAIGPGLNQIWAAVFVAWLVKFLILRYQGLRGYRTALPFFLGLILGDFVLAVTWTLIGMALGIETYKAF